MKPGYLIYEHRILVDLDNKEMVSLAEKEIKRGIEIDMQENGVENAIEEIELTYEEMCSYDLSREGGALKRKILENLKELSESNPDED